MTKFRLTYTTTYADRSFSIETIDCDTRQDAEFLQEQATQGIDGKTWKNHDFQIEEVQVL